MSTKSTPGDGQHGRGVKGGLTDADHRGPVAFIRDLVRGLLALRRRYPVRVQRPQYRLPGDRLVASPLAAAGAAPAVDVAGLARLFTGPGLYGEFAPSSYWTGVELVWPPPDPQPAPLTEVFSTAVAELCGDADTVGVKLSGSLDSLAALVHVAALRQRGG